MFQLSEFLPYRLAILSQTISRLIASEYESRFGLTMNQWRIIVVLAAEDGLSAKQICQKTLMDKMTVSRASKKLVARKLLKRTPAYNDARVSALSLTATGRDIHEEIIPLATDYERQLIDSLSKSEMQNLDKVIVKLHAKAQMLDG